MEFLVFIGALLLAAIPGAFVLRWVQRWFIHGVAALAEYIRPERDRNGSGILLLGWTLTSCLAFLYLVGAWCAVCVSLANTLGGSRSSWHFWLYIGISAIWCFVVLGWTFKAALGIDDPNAVIAYVHTETRARWEKADFAAMVALASTAIVGWLVIVMLLVFAIWPSSTSWGFEWLVQYIARLKQYAV